MKASFSPPPGSRRLSLVARVLHLATGIANRDEAETPVSIIATTSVAVSDHPPGDQPRRPASESRLYLEARRHIKRRAWGHSQRALEEAARRDPDCPAAQDLKSVRIIRRALHRVARWPSDVETHLDLGRAYFDLDLGDDALGEFVLVQHLAPRRYEGFALATLEYLYRGEYAAAMAAWQRAQNLRADLPGFEDVIGDLPLK